MSYNGENRTLKANETRQKIFASAEKLLSSTDFNQVSVASIVKMAGVSKGSFYVYFSSKEALAAALINDRVKKADTLYEDFLRSFPENASTEFILLSMIGKIADVLTEDIGCDKMKAIYKSQISKDFDTEYVMNYSRDIYKMFSGILERGRKRGEFKTDMPIDILTRHFMMAIRGITYEWCIRYPDFDYKAEAIQHFKIILKGCE